MPTYFYPFMFAVAAVAVGLMLSRCTGGGEADRLASKILYAVAVGGVIIAVATWWLWNHH